MASSHSRRGSELRPHSARWSKRHLKTRCSKALKYKDFISAGGQGGRSFPRRHGERRDPYAEASRWGSVAATVSYQQGRCLLIPPRAEPVIGRRFAPTRWLGRNDVSKGVAFMRFL